MFPMLAEVWMKMLLVSLLSILTNMALANESLVSDPPIVINGEQITHALWATSEKLPWTVMSTKSANPKWFWVTYNGGDSGPPKKISLNLDDEELITGLGFGGQALVYAKNIIIKQWPEVGKVSGMWATKSVEDIGKISLNWVIDTNVSSSALVARFDEPRDFVLSFNSVGVSGCAEPKMILIVDGQQFDLKVGETGRKKYEFRPGSTVIARGKLVDVSVIDSCEQKRVFDGSMQVLMK